jgi:type IV secretion system protein VirB10
LSVKKKKQPEAQGNDGAKQQSQQGSASEFPAVRGQSRTQEIQALFAGLMFGLKIILSTLVVAGFALFCVFWAASSKPTVRDQEKSGRNANMSDPSKLQEELIAAAEAEKHAKSATVQIIEKIVERTSADVIPSVVANSPQGPQSQVIVVQAPVSSRQFRSLTNEEREAGRRYRDMKQESLLSKSAVNGFDDLDKGSASSSTPTREQTMLKMLERVVDSNFASNGNTIPGNQLVTQQGSDPNAYRHKLDFLTKDGGNRTPQDYSPNTRNSPLAPMELKAGAVIPGILLVGVNSDLPGTVVGQVSENVYDTATGNYLLVPQGTRIIGVYDSRITHGQKRVAVVWNRLIYPDGSSLNIAGSPGTDISGYSGLKGRVDNHYGQLFTAALFTSVFTAAADIASGNDGYSGNSGRKSAKDVLVETTGTVIANTGARLAERALDIPPTITIRPGSRFNVMVTQDVVFLSPWTSGKTQIDEF